MRCASATSSNVRPRHLRRPGTTDFAVMLGAVASLAKRRSLVIVVSDFIGTGDWDKPLLRLTTGTRSWR